jgi:hypothetical protein
MDQARGMAGHNAGAVVPTLPDGWRLDSFEDWTESFDGMTYPSWVLGYRHEDGSCFQLHSASEGLGDVFVLAPPHTSAASAPAIASNGAIPIGWSAPDDPPGDWGPGVLVTEWFGIDGLFFHLSSSPDDGCSPIDVDEARSLIAGLRYLDPADDETLPGVWAAADMSPEDLTATLDPERHAAATFAGDASSTRVTTLRGGADRRTLLITQEGLMDDSVRDQRIRLTYSRAGDEWMPGFASTQRRCHQGRGHQDWSAEPCV